MTTDFYELLGVAPDADGDEIKRAYRRRARELHPDANPGDAQAEARFKEVAVAYETLRDPQRRRHYDQFGPDGMSGAAGFDGGFGDIFDAFFGGGSPFGSRGGRAGPPRGADLETVVDLEFTQAVFGAEVPVTLRMQVACASCHGVGAAEGTVPRTCPGCDGAGQVRQVRQSILGQMVTAGPCPTCGGLGSVIDSPCTVCAGDGRVVEETTYNVDIPAGIDTGTTLRLTGRGAAGPRGGGPGDLYVHVRVGGHPRFERVGDDLVHELHVSFSQAALGLHVEFETLDGTEDLFVAPGTQTGEELRLRGRGVPRLERRGRGDLRVVVVVDTPRDLSDDERDLLRSLAELRGEEIAPTDPGFFARVKSAFK